MLLALVQIAQGLALGAEWGGAILMSYEHAPWKSTGRDTGIVQAGCPTGLLLARRVFLAGANLEGGPARRIPLPASIVRVAVGLMMRTQVPESPALDDLTNSGDIVKDPIVQVIWEDRGDIVRGIGLRVAETAGYAVSVTCMISYLHTAGPATGSETFTALCAASAIGVVATMARARLTDRIGRRPLHIGSCAFAAAIGIPTFLLAGTGPFLAVTATIVIAYAVCQYSPAGAQGAGFPELFPARTRSSGAFPACRICAMVSVFTPFVTTLLFLQLGRMGPAPGAGGGGHRCRPAEPSTATGAGSPCSSSSAGRSRPAGRAATPGTAPVSPCVDNASSTVDGDV